jgi:hypothetical protein
MRASPHSSSLIEVFVNRIKKGGGCQEDHTNKSNTLAKAPIHQPFMRSAYCDYFHAGRNLMPKQMQKARRKKKRGSVGRLERHTK